MARSMDKLFCTVLVRNLFKTVRSNPKRNTCRYFSRRSSILNQEQSSTFCKPQCKQQPSKLYGQPSPLTHPFLLKKDEVTPGISKNEYRLRRTKFMKKIWEKNASIDKHLVIIPSASKVYMSDKIPYPFRQNSDFLYLCGFLEPDSVLILHSEGGSSTDLNYRSTIFVPKKDPHSELWDGPRSGIDGSIELLGVDEAQNVDDFQNFIEKFVKSSRNFSLWFDMDQLLPQNLKTVVHELLQSNRHSYFNSPKSIVHNLRLIKSNAEISLMQEGADIACESLKSVMMASHPMVEERLLTAKMEFECKIRGAESLSFPPVVAGGNRANTIHYIKNDQVVLPREMILMDAGCEYHGYSSDMTRTWSVNGRFTTAQRALYEVVLAIQEEMILLCQKFLSLDEMFRQMGQSVGMKLQDLGIIPKNISQHEVAKLAFDHCPHHVSHYLGMDVHDTPQVSRNLPLKPGMIITVEPGIYVPMNCSHSPKMFRGMGVRIEDDVLITENGPVILTRNCPKHPDDVEKLLGASDKRLKEE